MLLMESCCACHRRSLNVLRFFACGCSMFIWGDFVIPVFLTSRFSLQVSFLCVTCVKVLGLLTFESGCCLCVCCIFPLQKYRDAIVPWFQGTFVVVSPSVEQFVRTFSALCRRFLLLLKYPLSFRVSCSRLCLSFCSPHRL